MCLKIFLVAFTISVRLGGSDMLQTTVSQSCSVLSLEAILQGSLLQNYTFSILHLYFCVITSHLFFLCYYSWTMKPLFRRSSFDLWSLFECRNLFFCISYYLAQYTWLTARRNSNNGTSCSKISCLGKLYERSCIGTALVPIV